MKMKLSIICLIIVNIAVFSQKNTNDIDNMSIIPKSIQGNWFKTDGSNNWVIGIYENAIIYKNQYWDRILIDSQRNRFQIVLHDNEQVEKIHIKLRKNGELYFGEDLDEMEILNRLFTKNKQYSIPDNKYFDSLTLERDTAIYSGFIKGYSQEMGSIATVRVSDAIAQNFNNYLVEINPDGTFFSKIPMIYPHTTYISIINQKMKIYLEPGKETFQLIDITSKGVHGYLFMGECARINTDLIKMKNIDYSNQNYIEDHILDMSFEDYKEYWLNILKDHLNTIATLVEENEVSKKAAQIMEFQKTHIAYRKILGFNRTKEYYFRKMNYIPAYQSDIPLKAVDIDEKYLDFMESKYINDPVTLISGDDFNFLVNHILNGQFIRPKGNDILNMKLDSLLSIGVEMKENEKSVVQKLKNNNPLNEEEKIIWFNFQIKNKEIFSSIDYFKLQRKFEYNKLQNYFKISNGLLIDIFWVNCIAHQYSLENKEISEILNLYINDSFIKEHALRNKKPLSKINKEKIPIGTDIKDENLDKAIVSNKNEIRNKESDKIFESIINKYKGNIVFIDFWATWCGPCRTGIERIMPLKIKVKDRSIKFIYITNDTSPEETWSEMIKNIGGEHYRVSEDEWNYLSSKFNITGIPHYAFIDTEGDIIIKKISSSISNEELENLFNEYLPK